MMVKTSAKKKPTQLHTIIGFLSFENIGKKIARWFVIEKNFGRKHNKKMHELKSI